MTMRMNALVFSTTLSLLLGGCSTLGLDSHPRVSQSDMPEAAAIDQAHAKTLFLAVVGGLHSQGQSRAALAYLDDFDRKYPGDQDAALLRAECLSATGQHEAAEPIYLSLKNSRYAGAANAGLGNIAGSRDDWGAADAHFREAIRFEPAKAEYVNGLGFSQIREGQYEAGIDMLSRAAELDPDNGFIRNNLILGLHLAGREAEAAALVARITDPADRMRAKALLAISVDAMAPPAVPAPPVLQATPVLPAVAAAMAPTDAKVDPAPAPENGISGIVRWFGLKRRIAKNDVAPTQQIAAQEIPAQLPPKSQPAPESQPEPAGNSNLTLNAALPTSNEATR